MVGPKLYEANWIDLQEAGYIARVKCFEVWCPMAPSFYQQYWRTDSHAQKMKLCVCNPNKVRALRRERGGRERESVCVCVCVSVCECVCAMNAI